MWDCCEGRPFFPEVAPEAAPVLLRKGMYRSKGRSVAKEPAMRPRPDSVIDQMAMCAMLSR